MFQPLMDGPRTCSKSPYNLAKSLCDEMKARWRVGDRPTAADYLARFPELERERDAVLRLIYEEIYLNDQFDDAPLEGICTHYPQFREEVETLVCFHRLLSA